MSTHNFYKKNSQQSNLNLNSDGYILVSFCVFLPIILITLTHYLNLSKQLAEESENRFNCINQAIDRLKNCIPKSENINDTPSNCKLVQRLKNNYICGARVTIKKQKISYQLIYEAPQDKF